MPRFTCATRIFESVSSSDHKFATAYVHTLTAFFNTFPIIRKQNIKQLNGTPNCKPLPTQFLHMVRKHVILIAGHLTKTCGCPSTAKWNNSNLCVT
jgi:hypothetical protein